VLRARAESDQRDIGPLQSGDGTDVLDLDLPRDHFVAECDDDPGDEREAILALVSDQDAQVISPVLERCHRDDYKADGHSVTRPLQRGLAARVPSIEGPPQPSASKVFRL
jgi:hypothetical protein